MKSHFNKYYLIALFPIAVCFWRMTAGVSLPNDFYDFGNVRYGQVLHHRFIIKNRSIFPAVIASVTPACECTTAKLRDRKISPLSSTYLDVTFNTKGFHGKATRFIAIEVAKPFKKDITLTFDIKVNGAPKSGLEKILFSEPCLKCHVTPGIGKTGKKLYDSVCLMCHT